jgi:hypothetical protein
MAKNEPLGPRRESPKAFEAFQIYRDLGTDRSIAKVSKRLGKSMPLLTRWSARHSWVERAREWDEEQDRLGKQARLQEIVEMNKRHARIANAIQSKALERLQTMAASELKPLGALTFMDKAIEMERKARGEPTEIIEKRESESKDASVIWASLKTDEVRKVLGSVVRPLAPPAPHDPANQAPGSSPPDDGARQA